MSYREIRKLFKRAGWKVIRQSGTSHQQWGKGGERETIAGKDSDDVPPGLLTKYLKRLGLKSPEGPAETPPSARLTSCTQGVLMQYLAFVEQGPASWGVIVPELHASVVAATRDEALRLAAESAAFAIYGLQEDGLPVPEPRLCSLADLPAEDQADYAQMDVIQVEPAPINPVSVEVDRAIRASGLSNRELARRMGGSPTSVGRLRDLFYWGHSLPSLLKLAEALGRRVEFHLPEAS